MNKIGLIIHREYMTRVKKKSFILMTFLGPILMAGLMILAIWLGMSDDRVHHVLVTDLTPQLNAEDPTTTMFWGQLKDSEYVKFDYTRNALTNEEFEASEYTDMVVLQPDIVTYPEAELVFRKLPSLRIRSYIESQIERRIELEKLKLNQLSLSQYESIKTELDLITIDSEEGTKSFKQEQAGIGFAFAVIIYFFIFLYGVQVMRGIMEEKTSRIVEVIISSVKPFQLMMGKILGIALVGLTQFFMWVIVTTALLFAAQSVFFPELQNSQKMLEQVQMSQQLESQQDIKNAEKNAAISEFGELLFYRINWPVMLGMFIFFFLGGYLLYASLFAAIGGAVDSEADTQQFMLPITIPLIFAFLVAQFALENPDGSAVMWFSIIPFTSPIVMMVRVAMGFDSGTIWQLYLSMGLLIAGFIFTVWMAGKIYRTGILLYGKKITYKELGRWLFYKT